MGVWRVVLVLVLCLAADAVKDEMDEDTDEETYRWVKMGKGWTSVENPRYHSSSSSSSAPTTATSTVDSLVTPTTIPTTLTLEDHSDVTPTTVAPTTMTSADDSAATLTENISAEPSRVAVTPRHFQYLLDLQVTLIETASRVIVPPGNMRMCGDIQVDQPANETTMLYSMMEGLDVVKDELAAKCLVPPLPTSAERARPIGEIRPIVWASQPDVRQISSPHVSDRTHPSLVEPRHEPRPQRSRTPPRRKSV